MCLENVGFREKALDSIDPNYNIGALRIGTGLVSILSYTNKKEP